ncbi:MAG: phenylalanine--tRNA ligase subunit beta [Patescibacteria group bacterium]
MNILVSYNWLKEYLKTDISPEEFASRVSLCGPSVERIHHQGSDLKNIVVGKILNITKHPNADKLRIVDTDLGKKRLEIVCGGSNLLGGMKVAVALSGAKVKWHGEGELVELKPTEIRGVKSEGMICAAEEIGLGEQFPKKDEKEILDLSGLDAKPGTLLAEALNLKDEVLDIEVTTNRPDMMSLTGIAREAGTILKSPFLPPKISPLKGKDGGLKIKIKNDETGLCYRYQGVVIEGVKVKESPWWLKQKLAAAGARSINNIVDITNFVLWEMGQPLHAFDYEKLEGKSIIVRKAKKSEKIKALDGLDYKLKEEMLVIADEKKPVAIAGVKGGEATGVTNGTHTIMLESATFDPVSVRKTSRALNLRSESSGLFEKGLSTEATGAALARAAELVIQLAGGKIASKVFDLRSKDFKPKTVTLSVDKANSIMGVNLEAEEMADILTRLGFSVGIKGGEIKAKPPYWRENDIEIEEDLIEEIARVYGYHRLPSELPPGSPPKIEGKDNFILEKIAREISTAAGYNEILSYGMISKKMMEAAGEKEGIKIANPLSSDLEFMRTCLLPGLLSAVAQNENNFSSAKIFELSRVYQPRKKGELPKEELHFAGLNYGKSPKGELFYEAKGFMETILERFGIFGYRLKETDDKNMHPARSCDIYMKDEYLGSYGEIHPVAVKNFGIGAEVGFFYFDFDLLLKYAKPHHSYVSIPEYPGIKRDISFIVDSKEEYGDIERSVYAADVLVKGVEVFDLYEGKGVAPGKKSIALHMLFRSDEKTLEAKETEDAWNKIVSMLKNKFGADIRM